MLLAELEIRHTRAVAPTRRVALGTQWLPTEPAPGFGGILLGGVVAAYVDDVGPELRDEFVELIDDLENDRRVSQPRLRHRFQTDVVGLDRSRHKLVGLGDSMHFELDGHGLAVPQLLGAAYAASRIHTATRPAVFGAVRRAIQWEGGLDGALIAHLNDVTARSARSWRMFPTDERWALQILGFGPDSSPERSEVMRRFRNLIRESHPDHGGIAEGAGQRILELTEARRILLA